MNKFNAAIAANRELGFIRGLNHAQKLAIARGHFELAMAIGEQIISIDTFILANTNPAEPSRASADRMRA
jgi:hypothetical protein